jgi:tetratricopeptide (TPR) repeat protein
MTEQLPVRDTNEMMRRRNLQVTEQLLAELEAKRYESTLTKRILAAPSAFPYLLRACFLAQDRKYASARVDVEQALVFGRGNPVVELVAGMILYTTRDYHRALAQLECAAQLSPNAAHRARQQIIVAAGNLGWEHDVRRALDAAIASEPEDPSWRAQAVRFYVRGRHWQRALEHALAALELAPTSARMWMEAAGLHAALDQREPAVEAISRALSLMAPTVARDRGLELEFRREAARVAIDAGAFELALANLERAIELEPEAPGHRVELAQLASWMGETAVVQKNIDAALALDPEHAAAIRLRAALQVGVGAYAEAIESLEHVLALDHGDYQAHVWLSEALLRTGKYEKAHAQLHHASMNAEGFLVVAWLLRFLIVAAENPSDKELVPPWRTEEFAESILELSPALAQTCLRTRTLADTVAAVEAALVALKGNRSIYPTHVVDGELRRLHTRTGCRHASRWALQLLRVAPPEECLAVFDEIVARYPGSSLTYCHRGELRLWLGDLEGGKADLEHAIAAVRGTRWAWIGLSTIGLMSGEYQQTLDINADGIAVMNDTEGAAVYVYRGEAKRKLGVIDQAITELEAALRWHPSRASATINLALAYAAKHRLDEFELLWRRLRDEQAAGLLSDAAHELGAVIFGDASDEDDWTPLHSVKLAVLEHALTMMGGNRSSGLLTYRTASGHLRFVQLWPHAGHSPHARDHEHLEQCKRMLLKALAKYNGPRR